jgi:type III secretion system YscD/HrpQ family protein
MVAQFIAEEGPLKGLTLTLDEGNEWIIGRDIDQCDLLIEDLTVSRRHVLCHRTEEGYFIENLSETHPIILNRKPLQGSYLLHEDDLLQIGASVFRFHENVFQEEGTLGDFKSDEETTIKHDTIYEEGESDKEPVHLDLSLSSRFLVKVIAGPNTGAEFALDVGTSYVLGTDSTTCDIVFHDLSVSREHGRITVSSEGELTIEDLDSRNGIIVERERIIASKRLLPNTVVTIGTTSFLVLDREAEAATIAAPIFEPPSLEEEEVPEESVIEEEIPEEVMVAAVAEKTPINRGSLILSLALGGLALLLGLGIVSLFQVTEVAATPTDYVTEIHDALKPFPAVKYTYNPSTNKLFLVGHVLTGVKKSELLYNIRGLPFIKGIEDNVVDDEAIWQEMNLLLVKHPDFKGVSMHAPKAGLFVLTGYLQTEKQASDLMDYINVHFNYLSLLENRVVVDEEVVQQVTAGLMQQGFGAINVSFSNGELMLTGYISSTQVDKLKELTTKFEQIQGVRFVKNFVVPVSPEQGVIDLNKRYPGRYQVTGFSKYCNVNLNVVINGRILTRGDQIEGMIITSIQPKTIFLEKEGLKYKLSY